MFPHVSDIDELHELMRRGHELYKAANGVWHLTYRVGYVHDDIAIAVQSMPYVVPSSSHSLDMWCFGKTMDYDATIKARAEGKLPRNQIIYTDGSIGMPPPKPLPAPPSSPANDKGE